MYGADPREFERKTEFAREVLDKYGYTETESILNEWNYVESWLDRNSTYQAIKSLKGAAFTAAGSAKVERMGQENGL